MTPTPKHTNQAISKRIIIKRLFTVIDSVQSKLLFHMHRTLEVRIECKTTCSDEFEKVHNCFPTVWCRLPGMDSTACRSWACQRKRNRSNSLARIWCGTFEFQYSTYSELFLWNTEAVFLISAAKKAMFMSSMKMFSELLSALVLWSTC